MAPYMYKYRRTWTPAYAGVTILRRGDIEEIKKGKVKE